MLYIGITHVYVINKKIVSTCTSLPEFLPWRRQQPFLYIEVIKFSMLQLNDARVQRIIHERARYLDFTGSQAPILCRIILPRSTPRGSRLKHSRKQRLMGKPHRAAFMFSSIYYQRISVIELCSCDYMCTQTVNCFLIQIFVILYNALNIFNILLLT